MARSTLFLLSLALLLVYLPLLPQKSAFAAKFAPDGVSSEINNPQLTLTWFVPGNDEQSPLLTAEHVVQRERTPQAKSDVTIGCEQTGRFLPDPVPPPDPYVRTVQFGVKSTEGITGFKWVFHDGTTSTDANPQKSFPPGGPYTVTLICYGPEGTEPIVITGKVWVEESDYQVTVVPNGTPATARPPTHTPGPINTLVPTPTPGGPTHTASPTPRPSVPPTPSPTSSPGPSPTATSTVMPSNTPEPGPFCGGITYFSDPNAPANGIGFRLIDSYGIDRVRWTITHIGVSVVTMSPHFAVGPFTFEESGLVTIAAEAIIRNPRSIIDCGQIVIEIEENTGGGIELGRGTLVLIQTATVTATTQPPIQETATPASTIPVSTPLSPRTPTDVPTATDVPATASSSQQDGISASGATCPDWFVFHTERTGDLEIFRYGSLPDNPNAPENLSQGTGAYDAMPSLSPDRRWIVFVSSRNGNPDLYLARTDGSEQRQLTTNPDIERDPAWGPGGYIMFETHRAGNWDLWMYDLVADLFYQMTSDPADETDPSWSPDGTHVVFTSAHEGQSQLYELAINSREVRRLGNTTDDASSAQYSNDGVRIAFISERLGKPALFMMNTDGGEVVAISDPDGSASLPVWSSDDALLAYVSDLAGNADLYVYEIATGRTRKLTANVTTETAPTWRCASHQLVFMSDADGSDNLYAILVDSIDGAAMDVLSGATQLTDLKTFDGYPQDEPREDNGSNDLYPETLQPVVSAESN